MLARQFCVMNWISAREMEAPERKPCSSGSEYSRPERLMPRRRMGAPVMELMMRLPEVRRGGRLWERLPFIVTSTLIGQGESVN